MSHNVGSRYGQVLVSQRSTEKVQGDPQRQKSQPKYSAARQVQFMSRQLSYQMKKHNKISELVQKKKQQEVVGCTFQPKIRRKKNDYANSQAKPGRVPSSQVPDEDEDRLNDQQSEGTS